MDLPPIILNHLTDLERRFTGPIPASARQEANLPSGRENADANDIEHCIAYFSWLCASRAAQLRHVARWALASRGRSGLAAIIDRERFRIACRRLKEARRARDAWLAMRNTQRRPGDGRSGSSSSIFC